MPASSLTSAARDDSKEVEPASLSAVSPRPENLEELSQDECILRLEANGVGRVAAVLDCRPYICPVNYVVHEGAIIFRTRHGSRLHKATYDSYAALEIDSTDFMYHEGWTVLVQGCCAHVTDPAEIVALAQVCAAPWAEEAQDAIVRIRMDEVRGESIVHRFPRLILGSREKNAEAENVQHPSRWDNRGGE
jgi:nitroimidazol reductase NimA-like FMN-containing flavoprotein (pyridoxamine 5'-phosphate oxidase superfamily)